MHASSSNSSVGGFVVNASLLALPCFILFIAFVLCMFVLFVAHAVTTVVSITGRGDRHCGENDGGERAGCTTRPGGLSKSIVEFTIQVLLNTSSNVFIYSDFCD